MQAGAVIVAIEIGDGVRQQARHDEPGSRLAVQLTEADRRQLLDVTKVTAQIVQHRARRRSVRGVVQVDEVGGHVERRANLRPEHLVVWSAARLRHLQRVEPDARSDQQR